MLSNGVMAINRRLFLTKLGALCPLPAGLRCLVNTPSFCASRLSVVHPFPDASQIGKVFSEPLSRSLKSSVMSDSQVPVRSLYEEMIRDIPTTVAKSERGLFISSPDFIAPNSPVIDLFSSNPYGVSKQSHEAWINSREAQEVWEDFTLEKGVKGFLYGSSSETGIWSNYSINSLHDLKNGTLKAGGSSTYAVNSTPTLQWQNTPYVDRRLHPSSAQEITVAEGLSPYFDNLLGFAKNYRFYYPSQWPKPFSLYFVIMSRTTWNKLNTSGQHKVQKAIIESGKQLTRMLNAMEQKAVHQLSQNSQVTVAPLSSKIQSVLQQHAISSLEKRAQLSPMANRALVSFKRFHNLA